MAASQRSATERGVTFSKRRKRQESTDRANTRRTNLEMLQLNGTSLDDSRYRRVVVPDPEHSLNAGTGGDSRLKSDGDGTCGGRSSGMNEPVIANECVNPPEARTNPSNAPQSSTSHRSGCRLACPVLC